MYCYNCLSFFLSFFLFLPVEFSSEDYEEWLAQGQLNVFLYAFRKYSLYK